jgi:hypothetical protein
MGENSRQLHTSHQPDHHYFPYLVDLSPFLRALVGESFVNQGHDLIEQLATVASQCMRIDTDGLNSPDSLAMCSIGNVLHQRSRRTPRFIVCSFPNLTSVSIASQIMLGNARRSLRTVGHFVWRAVAYEPWIPSRYSS